MYKYNGTVDAVQITQAMMDGTAECPKYASRLQDTFGGTPVGEPKILYIDPTFSPKIYLKIGDWVVYSPFGNNILSNEDFVKFFL